MSGLLQSGIVNPDSQPPSPWSHSLPPPPNPPPPPPSVAPVLSTTPRRALSPAARGGPPLAATVESRPALSRAAPAPRPPPRLTLFCPPSGVVLGPLIVPLSWRLLYTQYGTCSSTATWYI